MASNPARLLQVRAAVASDLDCILEIERAAPTAAHWSQSDYESILTPASPRCLLLVAEVNAEVEGFLVARSLPVTEWEFANLVVAATAPQGGLRPPLVTPFSSLMTLLKPPSPQLVL